MKYHYGNMTVPTGEDDDIIEFFWTRLHNDCGDHFMSASRVYSGVAVTVDFMGLHQ